MELLTLIWCLCFIIDSRNSPESNDAEVASVWMLIGLLVSLRGGTTLTDIMKVLCLMIRVRKNLPPGTLCNTSSCRSVYFEEEAFEEDVEKSDIDPSEPSSSVIS